MGKIYDEIVKKAEELSKIENFEKSVNYRPFEIEITKIASSIAIPRLLEFLVFKYFIGAPYSLV